MYCCKHEESIDLTSPLEMDDVNQNDEVDQDDKYGKRFSNQEDGGEAIKEKRHVTDCGCIILFLAFLGGWIFVAVMAFKDGNIAQVLYPSDSQGNICGTNNKLSGVDLSSRKYLLFFDLTQCFNADTVVNGCPTPQVCVEKCPETKYSPIAEVSKGNNDEVKSKMKPYCKQEIDSEKNENKSVTDLIKDEICPAWYLPSKAVLGRCISIPEITDDGKILKANETSNGTEVTQVILTEAINKFGTFMSIREVGEKVFSDLADTWWIICMALLGACILSFVWILLMKKAAYYIVWFSIWAFYFLVGGLLAGCCYKLVQVYSVEDLEKESTKTIFQVSMTPTWHHDVLKLRDTWLAFTIILGIFFLIMLVIIVFLRNRIRLAIRIIREGSKAVGHVCSTLVFPIIPFLFQVLAMGWFLTVAMFLASSGIPEFRVHVPEEDREECLKTWENSTECWNIYNASSTETCDVFMSNNCSTSCISASCNFVRYSKNSDFSWMQAYNVFGLYWSLFFFSAFGEIVLAKVFAEYFWQKLALKKALPNYMVFISMKMVLVYHLGTVAFGSLILAIIRFIRKILQWLEAKAMKMGNKAGSCILCFCKCCFWCLEVFMKFINRNAYILCAVKGTSYCESAKNAFELVMRNPVRFAVLDSVCDFILLFGKLLIVAGIGVGSYFSFEELPVGLELNYFFVPIVIIVIGSYFIASSFFNVYSMAVDTIFLCALEDIERNNGAKTPKGLLKVFGMKQKQEYGPNNNATNRNAAPSCPSPNFNAEPYNPSHYSTPNPNGNAAPKFHSHENAASYYSTPNVIPNCPSTPPIYPSLSPEKKK